MSKEQVIDYVMKSPQNTNRAVLDTLLESMSGGDKDSNYIFGFKLVQNGDYMVADHTWLDFDNAAKDDVTIILIQSSSDYSDKLNTSVDSNNLHWVILGDGASSLQLSCLNENDYPSFYLG